jgi:predicted phosphate transport protein (TIGR00153 family)
VSLYLSTGILAGGRFLEEVINRSREHVKHAIEGVTILGAVLRDYDSLSYEEVQRQYGELNRHEEESDKIKRSLMSLLRVSRIHPEDREDLLRIVLTVDDTIGLAKAITKKLVIFKHLKLELPRGLLSTLLEMVNKSIEAVKLIYDLLEYVASNYAKALEVANKIEEIEEEVDEIKLKAFEELLKECSIKFREVCIVMPVVIDDVEKITDKCEDVADLFRLYIVSR